MMEKELRDNAEAADLQRIRDEKYAGRRANMRQFQEKQQVMENKRDMKVLAMVASERAKLTAKPQISRTTEKIAAERRQAEQENRVVRPSL
jgi:hypothetical protein